jgi:hypothetical protein
MSRAAVTDRKDRQLLPHKGIRSLRILWFRPMEDCALFRGGIWVFPSTDSEFERHLT